MENLIISNLTCRICLEDYEVSNSLYDEVEYEKPLELKDLLHHVANVIVPNDEITIPTRICYDCTEKLLNAFDFVCSVNKSEKLINDYLDHEKKAQTTEIEDELIVEENQSLEVLEEFQLLLNENDQEDVEDVDRESDCLEIPGDDISEVEVKLAQSDSTDGEQESGTKSSSYIIVNVQKDRSTIPKHSNKFVKGKYNCEKCQRSFAKEVSLQRHVEKAHTFTAGAKRNAVKNNVIQCSHCPRTFAREDTLQRHELAMHAEKEDVVKQYHMKHTYKRGLCPYCGESFSQASLIIHIRRHTGENPYQCDECDKGFPRRQDLIIHKRQHTGERPHVCAICAKSFIRPNKLARHLRVHTGQRPYKCTECDKGFAQSNDLKIHLRRHTGEKPYKCNVCDVGFICGAALKAHRRSKGHLDDPVADTVDPYASCRVNNRLNMQNANLQDDKIQVVVELDEDEAIQD